MVSIKKETQRRLNIPFTAVAVLLGIIGLFTLASTEVLPSGIFMWSDILTKQVIFVLVGLLVYIAVSNIDYTYFNHGLVVWGLYLLTLVLLVLTLFIGEEIKNVQRWLTFGGVQIQPSEIAKVTVILTTAYIFTQRDKLHEYALIFMSLIATLPFVILIFLQPHGSMAVLILLIWFITAFISMKEQLKNIILLAILLLATAGLTLFSLTYGLSWLLLVAVALIIFLFAYNARDDWKIPLIAVLAVSLPLAGALNLSWNTLAQDYQKERILSFQTEDDAAAFNVNQAKIAIGSGKIWGKGWGNGTQGKLSFLPEHQTDFIFASFAEEFGLIGSIILLSLYLFLLFTTFKTAIGGQIDDFGSILLVALGMKILLELFINIGTNTGITPPTGIPLPLMSAGGSITVMTYFCLGIIQSIMKRSKDAVASNFD